MLIWLDTPKPSSIKVIDIHRHLGISIDIPKTPSKEVDRLERERERKREKERERERKREKERESVREREITKNCIRLIMFSSICT